MTHPRLARGLLDRLGPEMGSRSGSTGGECPHQRTRESGFLPAPRFLRLSHPADECAAQAIIHCPVAAKRAFCGKVPQPHSAFPIFIPGSERSSHVL